MFETMRSKLYFEIESDQDGKTNYYLGRTKVSEETIGLILQKLSPTQKKSLASLLTILSNVSSAETDDDKNNAHAIRGHVPSWEPMSNLFFIQETKDFNIGIFFARFKAKADIEDNALLGILDDFYDDFKSASCYKPFVLGHFIGTLEMYLKNIKDIEGRTNALDKFEKLLTEFIADLKNPLYAPQPPHLEGGNGGNGAKLSGIKDFCPNGKA
jgi:hypothetical protein